MRRALSLPHRTGFSLLASMIAIVATGLSLGPAGSGRTVAPVAGTVPLVPAVDLQRDAELRAMILGRWQTQADGGKRLIENRADGTASLDVTFDFFGSLLYGDRVQFDLTWSIQRGELSYTMQTGRPAAAASRIMTTYGSQATYSFSSIEANRMHLVRVDDSSQANYWTRILETTK